MLFALRFAEPIARGEVDLTFRRWKRAQVRPGRPYRTPVGRLQVDEVDVVSQRQVGEKSNRMPQETSPLLQRVPVAEPRDRYPHTNVRLYPQASSMHWR